MPSIYVKKGYFGEPQVEITCSCGCGRKRLVRAGVVKAGNGKFFSIECRKNYSQSQKKRVCPICGTTFYPTKYQIDHGTGIYDSRECAIKSGSGQFKVGNPGRTGMTGKISKYMKKD